MLVWARLLIESRPLKTVRLSWRNVEEETDLSLFTRCAYIHDADGWRMMEVAMSRPALKRTDASSSLDGFGDFRRHWSMQCALCSKNARGMLGRRVQDGRFISITQKQRGATHQETTLAPRTRAHHASEQAAI